MVPHVSSHHSPYTLATTKNWWQLESDHSRDPRSQSQFSGLNDNLISCAELWAGLKCWINLNGTGGYIYFKGGNKVCSLQTLENLFILEKDLQSKSRCLVTLFSKRNMNISHLLLGHASWSSLTRSSVWLKVLIFLRNDGAKTAKRKYCRTFYFKRELLVRILSSIKWTGWEIQPHHYGQGLLHAYRFILDLQGLALCCRLCSAHLHKTPWFCPW